MTEEEKELAHKRWDTFYRNQKDELQKLIDFRKKYNEAFLYILNNALEIREAKQEIDILIEELAKQKFGFFRRPLIKWRMLKMKYAYFEKMEIMTDAIIDLTKKEDNGRA